MPARSSAASENVLRILRMIGQQLRDRRRELRVSATTTAEAAGMSRVTLHRIERGEPSVAMGAYVSAASALGLSLEVSNPSASGPPPRPLPESIALSRYPQLAKLAWQLKPGQKISPEEALQIYERNWRHIDFKLLTEKEREWLKTLLKAFGRGRALV